MTYVPRHFGLLAWLAAAMPLVFRPLWHRFLSARVESVYTRRDDQGRVRCLRTR